MTGKAIFWDFDGTLIYANHSFLCALTSALEQQGYCFEEHLLMSFLTGACSWYSPEKAYPDRVGELWWSDLLDALRAFCARKGVSGGDIDAVCRLFRENVIDYEYRLHEDALEVLSLCRDMGFENYILSNNFPELTDVVSRLGLDGYISGCFLSSEIGSEKPSAEIFRHAVEQAGNPEIRIMVGDNPVADIQGGKEAGLRTVLVHRTDRGCGADHVCGELREIIGLLQAAL